MGPATETAPVQVFLELLVLLALARVFAEAAERLGQQASVGELTAGILLAVAATQWAPGLPWLAQLVESQALQHAAQFGIFFLVLLAGIEMEPERIARRSRGAFVVAVGGLLLPLLAGFVLTWVVLPEGALRSERAFTVGVVLSITAVPATIKVLAEMGLLRTAIGETVISAAVFDDVLGLVMLAILTAVIETGGLPSIWGVIWLLAKVAVFFAVTILLGVHVYPRVSRGLATMKAAAIEFSALVAVGLAYGLLAELLGMHWIMGGFMAGLFFERARVGAKAFQNMRLIVTAITSGFLAPLFFLSIGTEVNLGAVVEIPFFLIALIALAFFAKVLGAGYPAYVIGLGRRRALMVGVAMTSRGAVELVVLSIALEAGVFTPAPGEGPLVTELFSALVIMAVVTTLAMPIVLGRLNRKLRTRPADVGINRP